MPRKSAAKTAGPKRPPTGRPFVSGDPRQRPGPGRPPDEFRQMMRDLANREDVQANLRAILADKNHPHYLRAYQEVVDRGYGKAQQQVDITSDGGPLQIVLRVPEPEGGA